MRQQASNWKQAWEWARFRLISFLEHSLSKFMLIKQWLFTTVDSSLFSSRGNLKWLTQPKGGVIKTPPGSSSEHCFFYPPLLHTLYHICIAVLKSEIWIRGTFGHWMGYENAGGAVWLGTKQDLVVRHTLLTLRHTANFETHC